MSGTSGTFSWTGTNGSDWNTAGNWTPTTGFPNAPSGAVAIDDTTGPVGGPIISGGSSDAVDSFSIGGTGSATGDAHAIVGGGSLGGTGAGTLTATSISVTSVNQGGGLVGQSGGVINSPSVTVGAGAVIGGGGTFDFTSLINNGEVQADGGNFGIGSLAVTGGSITGTGSIEVDGNTITGAVGTSSTLDLGSATSQTINIATDAGGSDTVIFGTPSNFTGSLDFTNFATASTSANLIFTGDVVTGGTFVPGTGTGPVGTLDVMNGTSLVAAIPIVGASGTLDFAAGTTPGELVVTPAPVCFARGTRMATPEGERVVEDLHAGDTVLIAGGEQRHVIWVGRRRVDCARHPEPEKILPVRIKAGAFGKALPKRDLLVSPQHAIFDEGVLIPARQLINGSTVTQETVDSIEYFHVELERHDVLLAEGLPAESYLDSGDRAMFENGGGALVLHPDFSRWAWDARACAEIKVVGPEVDAVRAKLARRAHAPTPRRRRRVDARAA